MGLRADPDRRRVVPLLCPAYLARPRFAGRGMGTVISAFLAHGLRLAGQHAGRLAVLAAPAGCSSAVNCRLYSPGSASLWARRPGIPAGLGTACLSVWGRCSIICPAYPGSFGLGRRSATWRLARQPHRLPPDVWPDLAHTAFGRPQPRPRPLDSLRSESLARLPLPRIMEPLSNLRTPRPVYFQH